MTAATSKQPLSRAAHARKLCTYRASQGHTLIPPARTKAHLLALTGRGWSQSGIEAATGVARCALRAILNDSCQQIRWATQRRILALPVQDPSLRHGVPSHGAARRLQALYALGHPLDVIAARVQCAPTFLSEVVNGRKSFISSATVKAVRRAYDELGMTVGPSVRARRRAARCGWAAPLCWDEEALDDPNGFPDWTGACGTPAGYTRHRKNPNLPPPCRPCKDAVAADKRRANERSCV